ncbi:transcriptional regulator [Paraburkholderia phymatum]|uniref:Transcriptional regulator n=1 Tax=Paraburkholderia phymatum TaxID=148447 RepID=A0ACC6TXD8_9BURK
MRQIASKAQENVATAMNIKQPSVSKIKNRVDMYLSTLRSYVEAVGGKLELTVKLPARPPVRVENLVDLARRAVRLSGWRVGFRRRLA